MSLLKYVMKQVWKVIKKADADRIAKQPEVSNTNFESCIPYINSMNPLHQLNLYYPYEYNMDKDGLLPVIIDIHGGGLMYGDKELNMRYCQYLASKGFCVMGMSYRLLPDTDLQGMVSDIYESIHWLEKNGLKRGFDLSKILLTGDSAGGHLASLIMCIQKSMELQKAFSINPFKSDISAVAISNGVCEMHDYFSFFPSLNKRIDREIVSMILGKHKKKAPWKDYMNFSQVMLKADTLPPVLVIGTENDPFYRHTQWLIENLIKHGSKYETILWKKEDGPHLDHVFHIGHYEWQESKITNDKMLGFFRKHF
ncbi:MAG: alpha/beta hydrolase [Clostridiaceae bacterium]|nr:alpha/beta hydrolase [Clostridiaceae bacterium]